MRTTSFTCVTICLLSAVCFLSAPLRSGHGDELELGESGSEVDRGVLQGKLELLVEKRDKFARNFGEGHPTILGLNEQIRLLQVELQQAPASKDPLDQVEVQAIEEMDAKELRNLVGVLVTRVRDLDDTVAKLEQAVEQLRRRP